MTYQIYYDIFKKKLHVYFSLLFTQNVVELLSAYFAFVEDDHSSSLAAAISLF